MVKDLLAHTPVNDKAIQVFRMATLDPVVRQTFKNRISMPLSKQLLTYADLCGRFIAEQYRLLPFTQSWVNHYRIEWDSIDSYSDKWKLIELSMQEHARCGTPMSIDRYMFNYATGTSQFIKQAQRIVQNKPATAILSALTAKSIKLLERIEQWSNLRLTDRIIRIDEWYTSSYIRLCTVYNAIITITPLSTIQSFLEHLLAYADTHQEVSVLSVNSPAWYRYWVEFQSTYHIDIDNYEKSCNAIVAHSPDYFPMEYIFGDSLYKKAYEACNGLPCDPIMKEIAIHHNYDVDAVYKELSQ